MHVSMFQEYYPPKAGGSEHENGGRRCPGPDPEPICREDLPVGPGFSPDAQREQGHVARRVPDSAAGSAGLRQRRVTGCRGL